MPDKGSINIKDPYFKLRATAYTTSKTDIITDKFTDMNKTQLKSASKNANIK